MYRKTSLKFLVSFAAFFALAAVLLPGDANAQRRDYLTAEEVELVRDAQEIDRRIDVLTKAIDRRFTALNINVGGAKIKKIEKWGEVQPGTRTELFLDIRQLLQKAIDDIDNVAAHPSSAPPKNKEERTAAERFPRAVRELADSSRRYLPALRAELEKTAPADQGPILDSIDFCEQIIEAAGRLPEVAGKKK